MTTLAEPSVRSKETIIQKYPLTSFFMLAIGLTWIFMIADALGSHGILPFRLPLPLMVLMGYMPTLAAVIVTGQTEGRQGVRALLRKLTIFRVGLRWYLFAIFGLAGVYLMTIFLYNRVSSPDLPYLSDKMQPLPPLQLALTAVTMFIVFGIVNGEELAWRGFATPRLQARHNALTASLIMGVIWSVFHVPLFFTVTGSSQADESFISFLVSTVAITVLYTWLLNNTRGSVLLAYLFHAASNTWTQVFPIDHANALVSWIMIGLLVLLAAIVVVVYGAENLSRKATRIQQ
jgi:uncharacterized protein